MTIIKDELERSCFVRDLLRQHFESVETHETSSVKFSARNRIGHPVGTSLSGGRSVVIGFLMTENAVFVTFLYLSCDLWEKTRAADRAAEIPENCLN
jgi:hypothetical protein